MGIIAELQRYADVAVLTATNAKDALHEAAWDAGWAGERLSSDWVLLGRKIHVNVKKSWEDGKKVRQQD